MSGDLIREIIRADTTKPKALKRRAAALEGGAVAGASAKEEEIMIVLDASGRELMRFGEISLVKL